MKRMTLGLMLWVWAVAGCSGDALGPDGSSGLPDFEGSASPGATMTASPDGNGSQGSGGNGGQYAIVTIGDRRYEVDLEAGNNRCADPELQLGIGGDGFTADGHPEVSLSEERTSGAHVIVVVERSAIEGGGRPYASVEDFEDGTFWLASEDNDLSGYDPDGIAVVRDWAYEGDVITGSAGFIEQESAAAQAGGRPIDIVDGTFELYCGPRPSS
jgi:hypothetical protein